MPVITFGNRLKEARETVGLTQEELADRIGLSVSAVRKIERGERKLTIDWVNRLAQALGVDAVEIVLATSAVVDREPRGAGIGRPRGDRISPRPEHLLAEAQIALADRDVVTARAKAAQFVERMDTIRQKAPQEPSA